MATAFRVGGQVVNGTAGTSVVVPNGGCSGGDQLIAHIACTGVPTITPPAGWTLIQSLADGTNAVTIAVYRKLAGAEGASWTWTLGASQRNWGWVGAYSGVDPTNPVAVIGTDITLTGGTALGATVTLPDSGQGIAASAAVRTASGVATTWTHTSAERADVSTNAGAGTDICGTVGDTQNVSGAAAFYGPTMTASQTQTAGAAIVVTLNPYFVPLDTSKPMDILVEAAFGADPDSDLSTATWTDISDAVRANVRLRKGALNENGQADPTRIDFEINNPTGDFTPDNPASIYWPNIVLDTPIRVSLQGFGVGHPYERGTAFVDSWLPSWDDGPNWSVVTVSCGGRLQRLQEGKPPIKSAAFRKIVGYDPPPLDYWPLEDESTASAAANAVGGLPASVSGGATFAAESTLPGSAGVVALATGSKVIGTVRRYTATGQWWVTATLKLPIAVTATTTILEMFGSGTARRWRLLLVPGSPDTLTIRAYDATDAQILDTSVNITEADVYGKWNLFALGVRQNGANVDFQAWAYVANSLGVAGTGKSGTLAANTQGNLRWAAVTATADMDGAGIGHLAAVVDPTFDIANDPAILATVVLSGQAGEQSRFRFTRLCQEEGVPASAELTNSGFTGHSTMGAQQPGSFVQALRDIETLDAGILHDGGPLGKLILSQRASRYNKAVDLTLTGAQLMTDFKPRFDNAARKGEVTASRPNGGSYRFFPAGQEGRYQDSLNPNVEGDSQLPQVASWRSAKGQTKGMRYPQFGIDLRANPELAKAWLASGISTRANITQLPSQHPTTAVDLFIDGYAEELDAVRWVVNPINCSPARPQGEVFQLESTTGNRGRLDTAGSELAVAVDSSTTGLLVATRVGPRWVTGAVSFDLNLGGEQIRATNISDATVDLWTRSASNGWDISTIGIPWLIEQGTASHFSATGTRGRQQHTVVNESHWITLDVGTPDVDFTVDLVVALASATGAQVTHDVIVRETNTTNNYRVVTALTTGGQMTIALAKHVNNVFQTVAGPVTIPGHSAGAIWRVRPSILGSVFRAKMWLASGSEPAGFHVITNLPDEGIGGGTKIALRSRFESGNTNTLPQNIEWDNLVATIPQSFTVQRGLNVSKTHPVGESVSLWQPSVWAL